MPESRISEDDAAPVRDAAPIPCSRSSFWREIRERALPIGTYLAAALLVGWLWNHRLGQIDRIGDPKEGWVDQSTAGTNQAEVLMDLGDGIVSGMAQSKEAGPTAQTRGERTGDHRTDSVPPVAED